jgi:hypothetical protein
MRKNERSGPGMVALAAVTVPGCGTLVAFLLLGVSAGELDEASDAGL